MNENMAQLSDTISVFLRDLDQAQKDYDWAIDEAKKLDCLTQDYLHTVELSNLSCREQAKIAKAIKECRMQRRNCKDTVQVTKLFICPT